MPLYLVLIPRNFDLSLDSSSSLVITSGIIEPIFTISLVSAVLDMSNTFFSAKASEFFSSVLFLHSSIISPAPLISRRSILSLNTISRYLLYPAAEGITFVSSVIYSMPPACSSAPFFSSASVSVTKSTGLFALISSFIAVKIYLCDSAKKSSSLR